MSTLIGFMSETASYMGITICRKCGIRTKMNYAESVSSKTRDELSGYTICHKCGNKKKWLTGNAP
jgi:ribosomal protein L40E